MDKGRVIIIGDIHGCYEEFEMLLNLLSLQQKDRVYLLGDLINRGPDSHRVVDIAREVNAKGVLGNHEVRLHRAYRNRPLKRPLRAHDKVTLQQLTKKDWNYLTQMTPTIVLNDYKSILVHAGFDPAQKWKSQKLPVITRIQVLDQNNKPAKRSECPTGVPWADRWTGKFVYYGHTPRGEVYHSPCAMGLDTACVTGGHLTACVLPQKEIVQVKAKEVYFQKSATPIPVAP